MGFCPSVSILTRKGKCLFPLVLCLGVLAWIATFSNDDSKEGSGASDLHLKSVDEFPRVGLESEMVQSTEEHAEEQPSKQSCPEPSPFLKMMLDSLFSPYKEVVDNFYYRPSSSKENKKKSILRGALQLSFKPSVTLGQVERENSEVVEGQFKPSDCTARQSVAILIPYRNREKHLLYLLYHLHPFLQRQQLHYGIYVIHQAGEVTFNRAKLLNVGYLEALKDHSWDCFIFHDVDLVPENDHNLYKCEEQPKHLVVGRNSTGYKLRYRGYFGGVSTMTKEQFFQVNSFPNTYWGWGGEDDDLRIRVQLQKMTIVRPPHKVARYTMIFHKRDSGNQVNKDRMHLLRRTPQTWKKDGLNSCSYKIVSVHRPPLYINITVDIGQPERVH